MGTFFGILFQTLNLADFSDFSSRDVGCRECYQLSLTFSSLSHAASVTQGVARYLCDS